MMLALLCIKQQRWGIVRNGVILNKLQALDEVLGELSSLGQVKTSELRDDWRIRRAVERDLQVLVEVVVDVCQRIIALSNESPATTSGEAVERCIKSGIISDRDAYRKMVQFHDFVVHRYESVDVEILADVVNNRLSDFESFRNEVLTYEKSQV